MPACPPALRALLEDPALVGPDVSLIATTIDGVVLFWNASAARLYGWRAEEALGRSILDLTPSRQSAAEAAQIMAALQAGRSWEGEIVLRRRDGSPFRAWVADIPVDLSEGEPGIVGASVPLARRADVEAGRAALEAAIIAGLA